jgi:hypothetical protein
MAQSRNAPRMDRNALVNAASQRSGGGGSSSLVQAMQQFMETMSKSFDKMLSASQQQAAGQAQAHAQGQAQTLEAIQGIANQAAQKGEQRRQEGARQQEIESNREYSMDVSEYSAALSQQAQQDAQELALILKQEEAARDGFIRKLEQEQALVADANSALVERIFEIDAMGPEGWDLLPNGVATRNQLLDLVRMSDIWKENLAHSPYSDKAHAIFNKASSALLTGEVEYESLQGQSPESSFAPIPAEMAEAIGLELPILTKDEEIEFRNRNGYPKGGVWALKGDDPKKLMVNAVGFSALTQAKMHDTMLSIMGARKLRKDFLTTRAGELMRFNDSAQQVEAMEKELVGSLSLIAPTAVTNAFSSATTGAPNEVLRGIYRGLFQDQPQLADKALAMSLPEGDPNRWEPKTAEDFFDISRIAAASHVVESQLSEVATNPELRASVAHWLGTVSRKNPSAIWQMGLSSETASALTKPLRKGILGVGAEAVDPKMIERATSGFIAKLNSIHRNTIFYPATRNHPIQKFRDDLHGAEVMQDAIGTSMLSSLDDTELQQVVKSGRVPDQITRQVRGDEFDTQLYQMAQPKSVFRRPINTLEAIATMYGDKTGAQRGEIFDYMQGGRDKAEEDTVYNPKYNARQAYYIKSAQGYRTPSGEVPISLSPLDKFSQGTLVPPPAYTGEYWVKRLHESRARAIMPPGQQLTQQSQAGAQPASTQQPSAQPGPMPQATSPGQPPQAESPPAGPTPQLGTQPMAPESSTNATPQNPFQSSLMRNR